MLTQPRPTTRIARAAGSGVSYIATSSSSRIGGSPTGVPSARKLSSSLVLVAVKLNVACIQPLNDLLFNEKVLVLAVLLPKPT